MRTGRRTGVCTILRACAIRDIRCSPARASIAAIELTTSSVHAPAEATWAMPAMMPMSARASTPVAVSRVRRSRIAAVGEAAVCGATLGSARAAAASRALAAASASSAALRSARCCSATLRALVSARTSSGTSAVSARMRSVCCSRTAFRSVARYWRLRSHVGSR